MKLLAIDPGDTSGWVYVEAPDKIMGVGNVSYKNLIDLVGDWDYEKHPIDVILVEDYIIFDKKRIRFGDRINTTRVLGAMEVAAKIRKIKFVKQPSSDLPTAVKRTGIDPYKGAHKDTHWAFAYTHAMYFFVQLGLRKSALQMEREKSK